MESRTINMLELNKVLQHLSQEAVSVPGQEKCLQLAPLHDIQDINRQSRLLGQAIKWQKEARFELDFFPDLDSIFDYLKRPEAILAWEGLWAVLETLRAGHKAWQRFSGLNSKIYPDLYKLGEKISWPQKLWSGLRRCLGQDGNLRDESSPGLLSVRQEIRSIHEQCTKKVGRYLQDSDLLHFLQDEFLTISSDRYVLALKSNFKGRLEGIIHDYSQTGETCYFEPLFLVELNNRLQSLKQEEKKEEEQVFAYLSGLVRQEQEQLSTLYAWLVELDVLLAKCKLADKISGLAQEMNSDGLLSLNQARHPLLALRGQRVVPVDLKLNPDQKALIITGGNSGGKTVCLKTLGLIALMVKSGLPVPLKEGSLIPYWEKIFVLIGDEQSLETNLSTFTAQIEHFARFYPHVDDRSLVILDEFGVGTDPTQGAALAQAVVDGLLEKKAWVALATHFPALKMYGLTREGVRVASVLFDPETNKPLFKLAYDQVGASQALQVAREYGLAEEILTRAEEYLLVAGGDQGQIFDRLNELAVSKEKEIEKLKKRQQELEEKYARALKRIEQEKERLSLELKQAAQEIIRQWKEQKISRKKALKEMAKLRERLAPRREERETKKFSWEDVEVGQNYIYLPWGKKGRVDAKDSKKEQIKIDLGGIALWVKLDDLGPIEERVGDKQQGVGFKFKKTTSYLPIKLDLRGKRVEDALIELGKFLDQAILSGRKELEIIHGKGTGALKKAVQDYLRGISGVKKVTFAPADQGGEGVTLVELV
ncbi:endonuclease MutS2 [Desulfovulcanus ferrireducens]|uniref:endonuclease MutS2 n=1 Tax=Desulfovulcanus ferrireducens TaxID=2831190 RepID=UPI0025A49F55|nr:endonuclease MutS2 [Desulfovulcanus ferrireducens]